jgi:hypothetical protein
VKHVSDGLLRRILDEPFAVSPEAREHLEGCSECSARCAEIRKDHSFAVEMLSSAPPQVDLVAARQRVGATNGRAPRSPKAVGWSYLLHGKLRWGAGAALVLMVAGTVAFTPARNVLTIFQAQSFSPISVTQGELRTLPKLGHYGYLRVGANMQTQQLSSAASAQQSAGFHILQPGYVPTGVPRTVTFQLVPAQTSSFTFSAAKARSTAKRLREALPVMPATIDGSTISLKTGNAVMSVYGASHDIPSLVVGQTAEPRVTSSGAPLKQIERYVLRIPGVSPQLAKQIQSIGDPTTTLPIPVPVNWAFAQHVSVQGHPGLLVGDNTGVASVVIWQADGYVYGVAGALTQGQVLQVANSLH